jgi:hypothetical protein
MRPDHFAAVGFPEGDVANLRENCRHCLVSTGLVEQGAESLSRDCSPLSPFGIEQVFPFHVAPDFQGILGLGTRLMADTYTIRSVSCWKPWSTAWWWPSKTPNLLNPF